MLRQFAILSGSARRYKAGHAPGRVAGHKFNGVRVPVYGINAPAGINSGKFTHVSSRCPWVPRDAWFSINR